MMGQNAEDIVLTTDITAEQRVSFAAVLKKFDDYFRVRTNTIYERVGFNIWSQQPVETVDQYIYWPCTI